MDHETNLPPEVAEAWDNIDDCMRMDIKVNPVGPLKVIHDYLLQVTAENARLHESALGGYEDGWHALRNERDSLRARIDAAPFVTMSRADVCAWDVPDSWSGKRVRLVLESDSAPLESGLGGIVRVEGGE